MISGRIVVTFFVLISIFTPHEVRGQAETPTRPGISRVVQSTLSLWADAESGGALDPSVTLRSCATLFGHRQPSGAIGTSMGLPLVYESVLARAALIAVSKRIPSRSIDRHLPALTRFIDEQRRKELPPIESTELVLERLIAGMEDNDDAKRRAIEFFEKARGSLRDEKQQRRGQRWREQVQPFLGTALTKDDPRVQTLAELCRERNALDDPRWIASRFADPAAVKNSAPELFAYAAIARVLSVADADSADPSAGARVDWRSEIRQRVLSRKSANGLWGDDTNRGIASSLARLALAWCDSSKRQ